MLTALRLQLTHPRLGSVSALGEGGEVVTCCGNVAPALSMLYGQRQHPLHRLPPVVAHGS